MSNTAVDGVIAAGHVPTWIIPAALISTNPTTGAWSIPLSALTDPTTVKADCHFDFGDVSVTRSPQTRTRQRQCQKVAQTIKTGETIDVTITSVYDQQKGSGENVNAVYAALPEGTDVYIAQAFGWDSATAPTTATVIDLYSGEVQSRTKNQPTSADEDLKFTSTVSVSNFFEDVALVDAGSS